MESCTQVVVLEDDIATPDISMLNIFGNEDFNSFDEI